MENNKIIFWRNFLLRTFFVGFLLAILLFVATIYFWQNWSSLLNNIFSVDEKELGKMFINSMLYLRILLFFIFLAPAIALHLLVKKSKRMLNFLNLPTVCPK